jgi:TonB family protein
MSPGYIPPKPVHQVLPNTRSFFPGAVAAVPQVEVMVKVDASGKVTDALITGSKKLTGVVAASVLTASRQWLFQPATLRGKAVPSEHTIVFQFRPER